MVEEAPVRSCRRRGVAVDLVLDRPRENRSQFVFTTHGDGRELIFWQSPRTTAKARPGIRSRLEERRGTRSSESSSTAESAIPTASPASRRAPSDGLCPSATTASPSTVKSSRSSSGRAWPTSRASTRRRQPRLRTRRARNRGARRSCCRGPLRRLVQARLHRSGLRRRPTLLRCKSAIRTFPSSSATSDPSPKSGLFGSLERLSTSSKPIAKPSRSETIDHDHACFV